MATKGYSSKTYNWLRSQRKTVSRRLLKCARKKGSFPVCDTPYTHGEEEFAQRLQQVQKEIPDTES